MKTLIFDFDGTIADSFEALLDIFGEIVTRPEKLTAAEVKNLRGQPLKDIIKYLKIKRWQIPRLILKAKRLIAARLPNLKTFDGMAGVLKQLHEGGQPMFILSTNSTVNITKFLESNALDGYFTKIYGDIGLRGKSAALKKLLKKEGLRADGCIYIGDETRDIEAAKQAGVPVVGVGWGFNNPGAIKAANPMALARAPQDLLKLLR